MINNTIVVLFVFKLKKKKSFMKLYHREDNFIVNPKARSLQSATSVNVFSGALKRFIIMEELGMWDT